MPIAHRHDEPRRWVLVQVTGDLTRDEVVAFMRTVRAPVEHQMWPMLVDARGATTTMTVADIEALVDGVRKAVAREGVRGHVALIADDDLLYSRFLLYETKCAEIGVHVIRVFRDRDEAERWLGITAWTRYLGG